MSDPAALDPSAPIDSTWREWVELSRSDTTRAAINWAFARDDIRQFARYTLTVMDPRYTDVWREVGQRLSDGETEHIDEFLKEVGGLMPEDQQYMLLSSALRDAVTAYEVYLATR
jgi:hypothetical protein